MPTTRLHTTVLLPRGPLPDCILLFCYPQAHYQTVYYCSSTHRSTTELPKGPLMDGIHLLYYQQAHCQIILLCYLQTHYLTEYYCCATRRPTTRLYTTILLNAGPLPDRIFSCLLPTGKATRLYFLYTFCYPESNYQTVY